MARILVKTTIPYAEDDWHVGRFSLLLQTLADEGHVVVGRDRSSAEGDDLDLADAAEGYYDQIWLLGIDGGNGLTAADLQAVAKFRERGGGLLLSRDHQDLGSSLARIAQVGGCQHFQHVNPEADATRQRIDDVASAHITWPNYHSGRNGDAQEVEALLPDHPLLRGRDGNPLRKLPAHPHEGAVSAPAALADLARVVARGRSLQTGTTFNLLVAIEAGAAAGAGRVVANSSFHHFCDCNWDPALGAPTFVDEPWGDGMANDPAALDDARAFVLNIARWLSPAALN